MANESSFTSEVIFFHKRLSNTPENVRKFIKILDVFLELTNTYYGGFQEVTTDDMEFNKQADYVESISYYFFSCGRWTYENSFNYINKLCKEGFERELNNIKENFPDCYNDISFYDVIGLGFQVTGTDYEPACQVLYEFDAESEIIGIKENDETEYEVRINSCEDIPFTAENVNEAIDAIELCDFCTQYGLELFLDKIFLIHINDTFNGDYFKKIMPTVYNTYGYRLKNIDLKNDIYSIMLGIIAKHTESYGPFQLSDISYYMNLEKDNAIIFEPFGEDNIIPIFKEIEQSIKDYIGQKHIENNMRVN